MDNKFKISACIILYNPGEYIVSNINIVLAQVHQLFVIDNSETNNHLSIFKDKNIIYVKNDENKGVATALNQAASLAIVAGFDYLLTLDQDSTVDPDLIEKYVNYINHNNSAHLGLLSPNYIYKEYSGNVNKMFNHPIPVALTSGSLLNLEAFKKTGPFRDELFIDYVDYEYCLRLRGNGFQLIQIYNANINHSLGSIQGRKFLLKKISVTNHSPLRLFYRTRNRFFVYQLYLTKYPLFVLRDFLVFINELIKILFYEDNKIQKYKCIAKGLYFFGGNKMGKYKPG